MTEGQNMYEHIIKKRVVLDVYIIPILCVPELQRLLQDLQPGHDNKNHLPVVEYNTYADGHIVAVPRQPNAPHDGSSVQSRQTRRQQWWWRQWQPYDHRY